MTSSCRAWTTLAILLALVAAALPVGADAAAPSVVAVGWEFSAPAGSNWLAGRVDLGEGAWREEEGSYSLEMALSVEGVPADAIVAMDFAVVDEDGRMVYHPIVSPYTSMWMIIGSDRPIGDVVLVLVSVDRPLEALRARVAVGAEWPDAFAPAAPLAAGAGAQLSLYAQWGPGAADRAVNVEVTRPPAPGGTLLPRQSLHVSAKHDLDGPALHASMAAFSLERGEGSLVAESFLDERSAARRERLVAPAHQGGGVFAMGAASREAGARFEASWWGAVDWAHVEAATLPLDAQAFGYTPLDGVGTVHVGGVGALFVGGCALPGDALDGLQCLRGASSSPLIRA